MYDLLGQKMGLKVTNKIEQQFKNRENAGAVRLNKYLSESGVCSRREADKLIEQGRVTVDGKRAVPGTKVMHGSLTVKQ